VPWANFAGAPAPGVYRVTVDPAMGLLCMKAFPRLRGESLSCFSSPHFVKRVRAAQRADN